jgi:lipopolysaccharide/colanic/teichoic acid biosynthesis glycosyltransferase
MATRDIASARGETPIPTRVRRRVGKRLFDVVAASTGLLLLFPVLLVIGVLVRITTPGNALFRQTRIGRHGRPFTMYKFRTMYDDCSDELHRDYVRALMSEEHPDITGEGGLYKLTTDPRVTPLGVFLRRMSLDELPQLLNVVRGDMSLVGPRPALPWETDLFSSTHSWRTVVRPGVTGLWQASGRNRLTMRQGLDLDIEYVQRQSFALDMAILIRTIPAVFTGDGAR